MTARYSPPLKPIRVSHTLPPQSFLRHRSRWLYGLLALILLYLWRSSSISVLPHRAPIRTYISEFVLDSPPFAIEGEKQEGNVLLILFLQCNLRSTRNSDSKICADEPTLRYKNVDWSRYAYSLYATSSPYLCNAVMVFEALSRLGSKADRVLFYPQEWDLEIESASDRDSQLLVISRDRYDVKLIPVKIPQADDDAWNGSFTKFMAWGQTQYDRVLHLDSDVTLLKHLDELFMLSSAPVAMLRAYCTYISELLLLTPRSSANPEICVGRLPSVKQLTSLFILLEPDELEMQQLMLAARPDIRQKDEYDMEILNRLYGDSAMILPHRQYGLLSGEFRLDNHRNYLGSSLEKWDPERVLREASLVHFSDWPLPKPWIMWYVYFRSP